MNKKKKFTEGFNGLMKSAGLMPSGARAQPGILSFSILGKKECECGEAHAKEGDVYDCMAKVSGKVSDPGAYCASIQDQIVGNTKWRGKQEADGSSGFAQFTRASDKKESGSFNIRTRLKESLSLGGDKNPSKFDVILIQEGLGNFRDAYYYTKESLMGAVQTFEGKKIYANHPSEIEEQVQPERSVKDILGHFENVHVETGVEGQTMLCASLQTLPGESYDWARSLMSHAVEYSQKYPDKDFVGLSINASGDAQEMPFDDFLKSVNIPDSAAKKLVDAKSEGIQLVKVVSQITDAVSVDLVTEAGAGGRIRSMLEENKKRKNKMKQEEKVQEDSVTVDGGKTGPALKEDEGMKQDEAGKESEVKEEEAKEDEAEDPAAKADGGADHDDEEQDKELIKKMLDMYVGPAQHPEEYMSAAKEAYQTAKESGMDEKEAMKAAGYSMKMAHVMNTKKQPGAADAAGSSANDASVAQGGKDDQSMQQSKAKEDEAHKESVVVTKKNGEIAALKEKLSAYESKDHLEKVLRESGLKMEVTKKFREALGKNPSPKVIDEKFKLFLEGYKTSNGGEADGSVWGFHTGDEKGATSTTDTGSFADCVKE